MAMTPDEIIASLAILGCTVRRHKMDELTRWGLTQKELAAIDEAIAIVESFGYIADWCHGKCYACKHINTYAKEEPCLSCQRDPYRSNWQFRWPERKEATNDKH